MDEEFLSWKMLVGLDDPFLVAFDLFSGAFAVSFREGTLPQGRQ